MKILLAAIVLSLITFLFWAIGYPAAVPDLVYLLNEKSGVIAHDISGFGRDGIIIGATWASTAGANLSLYFTQVGDRVASPLTTDSSTRTYMAWVNLQATVTLGRIFDKRTDGAEVELLYRDGSFLRYIRTWSGGVGRWSIALPRLGEWHHIALTYNSTLPTNIPIFYVDGNIVPVTTNSIPAGSPVSNFDPYIVGNRGMGDRTLGGTMNNVRIFSSIFSQAEIQPFAQCQCS